MRVRLIVIGLLAMLGWPFLAAAAAPAPAATAETLRSGLVQAQLKLERSPAEAAAAISQLQQSFAGDFRATLERYAPASASSIASAFAELEAAQAANDPLAFAAARADLWTALLGGSYTVVQGAVNANDPATASAWLPVREYRTATRFARPNADATVALQQWQAGQLNQTDVLQTLDADLLDTYQARLLDALAQLEANPDYFSRRAEAAAAAAGYFAILQPAYAEQRGSAAASGLASDFAALRTAAVARDDVSAPLAAVTTGLEGFRAAPLSPNDQARRAGQLLRFLKLVPVEYGRGVSGGTVTRDLEIQEAATFLSGAQAAFNDLNSLLLERDSAATATIKQGLDTLQAHVDGASTRTSVADADVVQAETDALVEQLNLLMPAEWTSGSVAGDFDVIASVLDRMEQAAAAGDYELAESARLEAYAVLESGPEARLVVFAPQYKTPIEELFWYGQGEQPGLARLIEGRAPLSAIQLSRKALDEQLSLAQTALGGKSAPTAVASNAAIIVFREGLEAVLILASLLASLKVGEQRRLRRPIWIGAAGAFVASALTWLTMQQLLNVLRGLGIGAEQLEAIVSLIAIGVLLLITNWFFHKVYWTGWMANFHTRKRRLIGGQAGLWLGLIALGFTSIYREGFETVLFLQALVLDAGTSVVLTGVAVGLAGTFLVGVLVFALQARLPHKKMLIVTGVMIGAVLLVMVGNTVHVFQVVGWMPLHPIRSLALPYWTGMWFGLFATWEGIIAQLAAGTFVVGSYYLAELLQHRKQHKAVAQQQMSNI